jgi:hypothetical protein
MKYLFVLLFFIPSFLFSQETIGFDDFETGDYGYGIMYVEMKVYENNIRLVNKYKHLVHEMPVINKLSSGDNTIYTFTGYVIDNKNTFASVNVKLKLLDTDFLIIEDELSHEFNVADDELEILIDNMNEAGDYIKKGKDSDGSFTIYKKLYVNDSDEIEDNFGMSYAYILYFNFENIKQHSISRRLMYYILEFTY